jgi:tRNA(Ile)-lysidine synthetase-like protein
MDHRLRGAESDADRLFVESLAREEGLPLATGFADPCDAGRASGIESRARAQRYAFIRKTCEKRGVRRVLVAHTADDQVETILMRVFEGAGISGLKGIPPVAEGGVERPLLDVWRSEILAGLAASGHPFRTDRSNEDTRFERNWVRHVLLPLLVGRYGEGVKRRIHKLGERFREIDAFIGDSAARWIRRNAAGDPPALKRRLYARLPSPVRFAVLQRLLHAHAGKSPNERLLERIDASLRRGGPSSEVRVDRRLVFRNRYDLALLVGVDDHAGVPPLPPSGALAIESAPDGALRLSGSLGPDIAASLTTPGDGAARLEEIRRNKGCKTALFDAEKVAGPLRVSPLAAGDRIVPFRGSGPRKVKEIMIDLKIPRGERWGRAVVLDAEGRPLWIPGVVRSGLAPVDGSTRHLLCLTARPLC